MSRISRAERIKKSILGYSTYEDVAEKTGISISTLVRISSGKTEPKFSDVILISKITGADLDILAYGHVDDIRREATKPEQIINDSDDEIVKAHNFIIWNISNLDKEDILSLSRQVYALTTVKKRSTI
ncbi:helix-turn-helix transcriptional regulator [Salmonella enterica]|uniref:Helix-turn-helix transcriptional regulator n=1 Tax=Erwinia papayae TaxID=206499 RepID=A0ABV3N7T8_9GAMM|nr:helix-turn-helix transcriptional regulator [Salmonella enterica]EEJ3213104.1 helix-turn-helix transcriptional regulator [Salmonella enterica subsp. houtenae serovar 40:z4,z24:-]EHX2188833.1 helix-turn-helix transcriptional regulator [Salmonella enterica subsp. enterica serovar Kedougou]MCM7958411.1 helix-turn-helix transcriptional regulator [Enterobacter hormaechei]HAM5861019.1 helix-turn-helix transcriptional regulator [Escherichia coli]HDT1777761.1 helix-turn-helix transcriptional regulat